MNPKLSKEYIIKYYDAYRKVWIKDKTEYQSKESALRTARATIRMLKRNPIYSKSKFKIIKT